MFVPIFVTLHHVESNVNNMVMLKEKSGDHQSHYRPFYPSTANSQFCGHIPADRMFEHKCPIIWPERYPAGSVVLCPKSPCVNKAGHCTGEVAAIWAGMLMFSHCCWTQNTKCCSFAFLVWSKFTQYNCFALFFAYLCVGFHFLIDKADMSWHM